MDVRSYLARLGVREPGRSDLRLLHLLHDRHLLQVPFENLDIHLGVPILLDEERILRKIVERGRGGFCYELNTAFAWLLRELGYRVTVLSAEVARNEGGFGIPFDHMTLRVDLDEPWLADVGFGESFRRPLPLLAGTISEQVGDHYRLRTDGSWWILERRTAGDRDFAAQYRFGLEPRSLEDFEPGCRYHQTSPLSSFTRARICTLALPEGRVTLHQDRLVFTRNGMRREVPVRDEAEWTGTLEKHFRIRL